MPDEENPYDDFLKNLARLVENIMKDMPDHEQAKFIGCTIIAGGNPGAEFPSFQGDSSGKEDIRFEMIESDDRIFVTTKLPATIKNAPYADITQEMVRICIDDREVKIPLPVIIDVIHSFYMVRHGVMDIVMKKKALQDLQG